MQIVTWNHKTKSREGTTLGNPIAMVAYALGVTPLIHFLNEFIITNKHRSKKVAFVDDFTVAGKAKEIKAYWENNKGLCLATLPNHPNQI